MADNVSYYALGVANLALGPFGSEFSVITLVLCLIGIAVCSQPVTRPAAPPAMTLPEVPREAPIAQEVPPVNHVVERHPLDPDPDDPPDGPG
jgi:hypothetical protein